MGHMKQKKRTWTNHYVKVELTDLQTELVRFQVPPDTTLDEISYALYETEERLQKDSIFEREGWSVETLIAHLEKPDWEIQCIPYALHWADANPRKTHHG